ncbi:hypothetical protein LEN26_007331 [Aphanomyces euteiches]|nr:hypothetical protein AeMF1_018377 [Aphanomyces euteiches]KAH9132650.1 hypothetical protein LEN26_007331 [Aphanomyces euteiches]
MMVLTIRKERRELCNLVRYSAWHQVAFGNKVVSGTSRKLKGMSTFPPPEDPSYNHRFAYVNGVRLHYIDVGPRDALPIVLVHGFPDLWWGWRFQIQALRQSYRVIVADNRGYGSSDVPTAIEAYSRKNVCKDYAELLDLLGINHAVFIGHDWGGDVVWKMCSFYPDRVLAVATVCTPYTPRSPQLYSLELIVSKLPNFRYQLLFANESAAGHLDEHAHSFFNALFGNLPNGFEHADVATIVENVTKFKFDRPLPSIMTQADFDYYLAKYRGTTFRGPLNWYRTRDIDWTDLAGKSVVIPHEALFIAADQDVALPPAMSKGMEKFVPNLTRKLVKGADHWVLFEKPDLVNATLLEWLAPIAAKAQQFLRSAL